MKIPTILFALATIANISGFPVIGGPLAIIAGWMTLKHFAS